MNNRPGQARRAGIATMWIILTAPVMLLVLCLVLEIGNLWIARSELIRSLESAALAAVKRWGDGGSTTDARNAAKDMAALNKVLGQTVNLGLNQDLSNPNGNDDCAGSIVLGGLAVGTRDFDASGNAGCGRSKTFNIDLTVSTPPNQTTFGNNDVFEIKFNSSTTTGISITSATFDLQGCGDDGVFQPATDPTIQGGDAGFGPQTGPVIGTIAASYATTTSTVTVTFPTGANSFDPGETFTFGIDTDFVGDPATDQGGAFGPNPGANVNHPGIKITLGFSDGTSVVMPKLKFQGPNTSSLIGQNVVVTIPDLDFAARTRATVSVPAVCSLFGSFTVTASADAVYRCSSGSPQLIRFTSFKCP